MFTVADARRAAVTLFMQSAALNGQTRSSFMLDADVLLQHFLKKTRAWLFAHDDADISAVRDAFLAAVAQRATGLPIAYITGEKEFWGLPFHVTPDVLIPKPDTELLVERSLTIIKEKIAASQPDRMFSILDPCTGSGCVILSILHTLEMEGMCNVRCVAIDISPAALAIARFNARRILSVDAQARLLIMKGDMRHLPELPACCVQMDTVQTTYMQQGNVQKTSMYPTAFDLIAANPPYVPSHLTQELLQDGRSEPALALDGGMDGLDFIRVLTNNSRTILGAHGVLLTEVGEYHAKAACGLFEQAGFSAVRIHQDWAHQDRLIEGALEHPHKQ